MTSDRLRGKRPRSLTALVVGLCAITALLVGGMFTLLLVSVVDLHDEDTGARQASDQLTQSFAVERSVVDLETGVRGYLITRDAAFLTPYQQALIRLPDQLAGLRASSQSRSEQAHVNAIGRAIRSYIADYAAPLIASRGTLSRAQEVRAAALGKQRLDALRTQFDQLSSSELKMRAARRATVNATTSRATIAATTGLAVSVLLLAALGVYIVRRLLVPVRAAAAAAERVSGGQLAARVPEIGIGEVALLGRSFNEMAETLQARDWELSLTHDRLQGALREAREVSTMKSNFVANMSHEIRTPLNGVVGMMELLSETPLTSEQREYLSVARASGDALMSVVNDVLDVAKIEAGRLDLEQRDFDLHELVEAACDMVAATAASRSVELQSFVHDGVPQMVCGDRMRVGQILANLMSNAVKFTPEGEVVLEVAVTGREDSKVDVRFEVRDTGIGIAPERIHNLFEPFTQADAGTTRTYGGTGLGLTIVRELSRLMGGSIDVDSELGRGSTFGCTLPLAVSRQRPPTPAAKEEMRGLHVLIVDDNATNRRIFEAYTAAWGMRPAQAYDADSAMAALTRAAKRGDAFDVALLDFHMPERSGLDLAREIRASAQLKRTRIILLTSSGQALPDDPANGIDFALSKPVRQSRLLDAISAVMAEQWAHADDGVLEPAPAEPPVLSGGGQRILVAEDQPVNWMLVQRMLTKRGYRVDNAVNGEQALRMLETEPYDLVFMDCQMPVLDGYQTSREIRKREDAARGTHIPIVAMTAHAMQGDRERCLAAGMDDYLAKPITRLEIDEMLRRWLPSAGVEAEVASTGPGASTPAPADSVLEDSRIRELRTLFPGDELKQVLRELEEDVAAQMQRIDSALRAGDGDEVADAAHRVLNSARMVGAANLVQAAAALEDTAHDREQAPREAAALREHWHAVADALASESAAEHSRSEAEEA